LFAFVCLLMYKFCEFLGDLTCLGLICAVLHVGMLTVLCYVMLMWHGPMRSFAGANSVAASGLVFRSDLVGTGRAIIIFFWHKWS